MGSSTPRTPIPKAANAHPLVSSVEPHLACLLLGELWPPRGPTVIRCIWPLAGPHCRIATPHGMFFPHVGRRLSCHHLRR